MPIKSIVKLGNSQLATRSKEVIEFSTSVLDDLIQDMHDTMLEKGGVGIAAPQIGYNVRVLIFGFDSNARYPNEKPVPYTVLINPVIEVISNEIINVYLRSNLPMFVAGKK